MDEVLNKVLQGDCLVELLKLTDESVDLIITDPPYGVVKNERVMFYSNLKKKVEKDSVVDYDSFVDFRKFTESWFGLVFRKLKKDSFMYVFWSQKYLDLGISVFHPNRVIINHYPNSMVANPNHFIYDYEPIFVIEKGRPKLSKGKHSSVLRFVKPQSNFKKDKLYIPTQKSLDLVRYLISISSKKNDVVLDCFMGAGTVAVACKQLDRRFVGVEKNPYYCEIIQRRLDEQDK